MPDYVLEGPKWAATTITWSFANPANPSNQQTYTGSIGAIYQQTIQDAFTRWASVAGLTFVQATDSTSVDIRFGWGNLPSTASSYTLGLTPVPAGPRFRPDVEIQLEDPQYLALNADPTLGWLYGSTAATLFQVALHEIGHALGLGHDTDLNSVMYPTASASTRNLDATDIAGIDALYGISAVSPGQFAIAGVSAPEGNSGTSPFVFTVSRTGGTAAASVQWATQDGTATVAAGDYVASSGTLVFAAGVMSETLTVPVIGNTRYEPDKTFSVQLANPTNGAGLATAQAAGVILNDDPGPGSLAIDSVAMAEGNAGTTTFVFTVTRSLGAAPITVDFRTQDGTATVAAGDYVAQSGTLGFGAGVTTRTISVTVNGNTVVEPDETFSVVLSNASGGGTIATAAGTGTILNDDVAQVATGPVIGSGSGGAATTVPLPDVGVYRFFDRIDGTHFFTASAAERDALISTRADMAYEGVGLSADNPANADPAAAPVYRFFDTIHGTHFFTASQAEKAQVSATRADLTFEGIGFYEHTAPASGDVAVYRFFDATYGTHFYTADATERASLLITRPDLKDEGVGFYAPLA